MRIERFMMIFAVGLLCLAACDADKGRYRTPEWEDPTVDPDPKPEPSGDKPFYIWVDAAANFPDFANSKENILRDLTKAREAGFSCCAAGGLARSLGRRQVLKSRKDC